MNTLSKRVWQEGQAKPALIKVYPKATLHRELNLHRSYISGIERGVSNPSLGVVEKIAKALSTPIRDLIK